MCRFKGYKTRHSPVLYSKVCTQDNPQYINLVTSRSLIATSCLLIVKTVLERILHPLQNDLTKNFACNWEEHNAYPVLTNWEWNMSPLLGSLARKPSFWNPWDDFLDTPYVIEEGLENLEWNQSSLLPGPWGCCHAHHLSRFSGVSTVSLPLSWYCVLLGFLHLHCISLYCRLASSSMFCYRHMANLVLRGPFRRSPCELVRFLAWEECFPDYKSVWCTEHFTIIMDHSP